MEAETTAAERVMHWKRLFAANLVLSWFLGAYFLGDTQGPSHMTFRWTTHANTGSTHYDVAQLYKLNKSPEPSAVTKIWEETSMHAKCAPSSDASSGVWGVASTSPLCSCLLRDYTAYAQQASTMTANDFTDEFREDHADSAERCFWHSRATETAAPSTSPSHVVNVASLLVLWNAMACLHAFFCGLEEGKGWGWRWRIGWPILFSLPIFVVFAVVGMPVGVTLGVVLTFIVFFIFYYSQIHFQTGEGEDPIPKGLRQSYVFWPLYTVALATALLTLNEANTRRDSDYNVSGIVFVVALGLAFCSMDVLDYCVQDDDDGRKDSHRVWKHAVAVLVVINLIQSSSSSEVISPNRASGAYLALILLLFVPMLPYLMKRAGGKWDDYAEGLNYGRACLELPARAILTIALCADMQGMRREDRL